MAYLHKTLLVLCIALLTQAVAAKDQYDDEQVFIENHAQLLAATTFVSNIHQRLRDCSTHYAPTKTTLAESLVLSEAWMTQFKQHFEKASGSVIFQKLENESIKRITETRGSSIYTADYCLALHHRILTRPLPTEVQAFLAPTAEQ